MKVTQTTTFYTKTNFGYEIDREDVIEVEIGDDEYFPQDFWINELCQVQYS